MVSVYNWRPSIIRNMLCYIYVYYLNIFYPIQDYPCLPLITNILSDYGYPNVKTRNAAVKLTVELWYDGILTDTMFWGLYNSMPVFDAQTPTKRDSFKKHKKVEILIKGKKID